MITTERFNAVLEQAECLCAEDEVTAALGHLAESITRQLKDANPLVLCVMVGALIPLGHLLTRLQFPLDVDYIHATRYRGAMRGGDLHWLVEPHTSLKGRTVLVVDDIMDGGLTLAAILDYCTQAGARKTYSAVMVNKIREREPGVNFEPDFIGLSTPDRFLFGFGLDYEGYWRNLPAIYAVKE